MLKFKVTSKNPISHYLEIEATFDFSGLAGQIDLILPSWRPGRYEGADYIKNVRQLFIKDLNGDVIEYQKATRNTWRINPEGKKIIVTYSYFAFQADAGASYIDDEFWLLNFINFLVYPEGYEHKNCLLHIHLPQGWQSATTLKGSGNEYSAEDYFELTDRPLLAGKEITEFKYEVNGAPFYLHIGGKSPVDVNSLIPSFRAFSEVQLNTIKSCPFDKYYFLILILPYRFYHGVEHADNTVLVLGIDEGTDKQKFIDDLLGVASHELFHAWNIKKIRPKELLPYNFKNFIIFNSGIIVEGFTTYYGDLFLVRSGVWTISRYMAEMNQFLKRHYRNTGRYFTSLTTSSENLWIDGYKQNAPFHKVSIYVKGAIVSMMLDMRIRMLSNHTRSLDDLIRWMDEKMAYEGYSLDDIKTQAEALGGEDMTSFFQNYAYGVTSVDEELSKLSGYFGLKIQKTEAENSLEKYYGFSTSLKEDMLLVEMIDIASPAESALSIGDQIVLINNEKPLDYFKDSESSDSINIRYRRLGRIQEVQLNKTVNTYFSYYQLTIDDSASPDKKKALKKWLTSK